MVVDHFSDFLDQTRSGLTAVVTPVLIISDYPTRTANTFREVLSSRGSLQSKIFGLEQEQL
ncbi:MAG: hypothetical protein ACI831_001098, partial [Candidatus Azotimanducaceae bacterium]